MGLQHQVATRQRQVASKPWTLGACWLLHHLNQHLLTGLQQLGNTCSTLLQTQRAQISDMDKTIFLTFPNIHKSGINARENVLDRAEVDISDLVSTLSDDQLIDSLICEQGCDPQLLRDDNLLGHRKINREPCWTQNRSMACRLNASGGKRINSQRPLKKQTESKTPMGYVSHCSRTEGTE
ncbi:hypothetical protein EV14_3016 [Prochlorococcus sp. MIT 0703]|nr:hypothetical protein EV14_3016 [Prochlorococcus sp. MIT 0703]